MVAVITVLARIESSIAAAFGKAGWRTAVASNLVAVITFFTCLEDAIAACRCCAEVGAVVVVDLVAIIACFKSVLSRLKVLTNDAIAAAG